MGPKPKPIEKRFMNKVEMRGEEDCWEWLGALSPQGYGKFRLNQPRTMTLAHRVSYLIHVGDIPEGMFVCHHCDNKSCCNPKHLFLGTAKDNNDDKLNKGRHISGTKGMHINYGSTHGAAKLTEDQVREIRIKNKDYSYSQLAKMYGVSLSNIWWIVKRKGWKHVE